MSNAYFLREEKTVTRSLGTETVVLPVCNDVVNLGSVYTLNETGTWIWQQLDGSRSTEEIAAGLAETFEVTREQARQHVEELIADLVAERLVRARDETRAGPG